MPLDQTLGTIAFVLGVVALVYALTRRAVADQRTDLLLVPSAVLLGTLHNVVTIPAMAQTVLSFLALVLALAAAFRFFRARSR